MPQALHIWSNWRRSSHCLFIRANLVSPSLLPFAQHWCKSETTATKHCRNKRVERGATEQIFYKAFQCATEHTNPCKCSNGAAPSLHQLTYCASLLTTYKNSIKKTTITTAVYRHCNAIFLLKDGGHTEAEHSRACAMRSAFF